MQDAIAVQSLKSDIALLRQNIWPPQNLANVEGLPIYYGTKAEVEDYYRQWTGLIERAQDLFQPFMEEVLIVVGSQGFNFTRFQFVFFA